MSLLVIGINHTTAAIELREQVAFAPEQIPQSLLGAVRAGAMSEAVILSTCNRTELIVAVDAHEEAGARVLRWFFDANELPREQLEPSLYQYREEQALRHLIKVASGLDSMVIGEPQIFGQMKAAYATARNAGTIGPELSRVMHHVFAMAKKVRTDTAIGENPVSVAFAAVKLARHIFTDLSRTSALLIGAGETIELVARHLHEAGVEQLTVANRTLQRGEALAQQIGARAILLADIPQALAGADIVISSTASQLPILGKGTVEQAMRERRHKPIFMVDIAVPRDIEPQVAELPDVYLYSVDDLEQIIDDNRRARASEAERAGVIIDAAVQAWVESSRSLDAVGALRDFREQAERVRDGELERALRQLRGGTSAEQVLEQLARSLTNKLLHGPSVELRRAGAEGRTDLIDWGRRLLGLQERDKNNEDGS